jgi:hypothetical protein
MISDRTKQFIYNHLIKDLSNVEIISHEEALWFIDRENKYWYLELSSTGKLYWRFQFFTQFFEMFNIERIVYEQLIKEFVELVLNCGVTSSKTYSDGFNPKVEKILNSGNPPLLIAGSIPNTDINSVLNDGVSSTHSSKWNSAIGVEAVLSSGITSTHEIVGLSNDIVDSVLNNGITSTEVEFGVFRNEIVEDVLNNGVTSSRPANKSLTIVDSVLTNGVTNTTSLSLPYDSTVNLVLNETVNRTAHLNSARELEINKVLNDNPIIKIIRVLPTNE